VDRDIKSGRMQGALQGKVTPAATVLYRVIAV
jgi:hypothetical protein